MTLYHRAPKTFVIPKQHSTAQQKSVCNFGWIVWLPLMIVTVVVAVVYYPTILMHSSSSPSSTSLVSELQDTVTLGGETVVLPAHDTTPVAKPIIKIDPKNNITILYQQVEELKSSVRVLRNAGVDQLHTPEGTTLIQQLQQTTSCYLEAQYGNGPYQVEWKMEFPKSMINSHDILKTTTAGVVTLVIETAPPQLLPHAVFTFLEVMRLFRLGEFHRNAKILTQSTIFTKYFGGVVFMEYNSTYPHDKYTVGFGGKGGINSIIINLQDNSILHGPGEGNKQEPHTVFGSVIQGREYVDIMSQQPVNSENNPFGFIHNRADFIYLREVKLPQSKANGEYIANPPQCMIDLITAEKKTTAEKDITATATATSSSTTTTTTTSSS